MNTEKLLETIDNVKPNSYWPHMDDFAAILERRNLDPVETAFDAFRYGFLKGQRAERARRKASKKGAK